MDVFSMVPLTVSSFVVSVALEEASAVLSTLRSGQSAEYNSDYLEQLVENPVRTSLERRAGPTTA
jgi:hypothetical protein